jgi:transcriptional regulator with XRE-family HTH domain
MASDKTFGELFRAAALSKDGSLKRFSERTGIDYATVNRWANDRQKPEMSTIERLAMLLDIAPHQLFPNSGGIVDEARGQLIVSHVELDRERGSIVYQQWVESGGRERYKLDAEGERLIREIAGYHGMTPELLDANAISLRAANRGVTPPAATDPGIAEAKAKLAAGELKRPVLPKKRR